MPVVVITKRTFIAVIVAAVVLIAALVLLITLKHKGADTQSAAPVMATGEQYELNILPINSKVLPVYSVEREDKVIALTIDAAWSTDKTEFILKTLEEYDVKATFFLCGVWVEAYPDYVKEIAKKGHEIGNHTKTHPHCSKLSAAEIETELKVLDDEIERLTGERCTLFRAPFGEYNDTVINTARAMGYEVVQWSRDTVDWKESRTMQQILDSVLPKLKAGDIILCHNNGFLIEEYLPKLIETALEQGYRFVTVSELLLEGETTIDNNGMQQKAG
ncbi:MAG TPA: polysaccharide deacetylase family protein [Eubacteriales bacterium]|nr:polysaccharide deacetylase family protein [Clostridia bacterium]HRV73056.1 polysaccharide deacetylase family protein [Eubacteriales bacterium]